MDSSMECSIKKQKIQAMKSYKRARFLYNLVLYSLTSIITCLFFSYPFWFPSINHILSHIPNNVSFFLNAKCFFVVGNLIVLILVGESKRKQPSSSTSDRMYDEYVARSRSSHHEVMSSSESMKSPSIREKKHGKEEKIYREEKKEGVTVSKGSMPNHEEKRKGMRTCKSEVWGESGIVMKGGKTKGNTEEQLYKKSMNHEEKKMGMRSCKSEVWGENGIVMEREKAKGKKEEQVCKGDMSHEEKKMGMRSCKSEIWGESEIVKKENPKRKEEVEQPLASEDLNKRVEAFIARVNKQRLLEAKLVDHSKG